MLKITFDENNSIAILEPQGKLLESDFTKASKIIDPYIKKAGSLKGIIIYTKDFPYWDSFGAMLKHFSFVNEHHKKISFVAFVSDSSIGSILAFVADHFVNAKIKHFAFDEFDKAKRWIKNNNTSYKHGFSVAISSVNDNFLLSFTAIGKLTHEDYEKITPVIDAALEGVKESNINVFADISELDGWEIRAAWDDLKIGIKYGFDFNKIAIYGTQSWLKYGAKISSWFTSGDIRQFSSKKEALSWLDKYNKKRKL